jgi:hypothetical protein
MTTDAGHLLHRYITYGSARLAGWPDTALTLLLLAIAAAVVIVALQRDPMLKALVIAWAVLP